ncbi:unannotated protein [freshwater metagenome]|uniref:Unannotated protein n=1 Tax=freshwater metagenome TaxID=449393 RepID=A0A6J6XV92_9ZZZZ
MEFVKQCRDRIGISDDPCDVAGRRKRSDEEWAIGVSNKFFAEMVDINVAVNILRDNDNVGHRFAPRKFIGVMLEGSDENHGALVRRNVVRQVVLAVQVCRNAQIHHRNKSINGSGRARANENDDDVVFASESLRNNGARIFAQSRSL